MLIQQDWLMRQIEMLIDTVTRLLAGARAQGTALPERLPQESSAGLARELAGLLRQGQLGKAEDLLFDRLDPEDTDVLAVALDFYRQANAMTDGELETQGFTRDELWEGLGQAAARYGFDLAGLWPGPPGP